MKDLNSIKWGNFQVQDIFDIKPGKRLTKGDMIPGNTPFIGATDSNNGITCFCGNHNASLDSDVLGVNYNGSVVDNFYHPYRALFSDDVKRLRLKKVEGSKYIYLFIKVSILQLKKKYQYGYKFNGERMNREMIVLPITDDGSPDYAFMEEYMKEIERKMLLRYKKYIKQGVISVQYPHKVSIKWKNFQLEDAFDDITRGRRLKNGDHVIGCMPYVSSSAMNNGVDDFVSNNKRVRIFSDCLSLANSGSVGVAFYHPYEFVASDHVTRFKKEILNKYSYLYHAVILEKSKSKYGYNREINNSRIKREQIMLPVTKDGSPDYEYMEKYMKAKEAEMLKRYIDYKLAKI